MRTQDRLPTLALLIAASTLASAAHAQQKSPVATGSWIIAGTGGLSSSHDDGTNRTTTNIYLSPSGMRFMRPGLAVGGLVTLGYGHAPGTNFYQYGLGPSARYYFGDPTSKVLPFVGASVVPQWLKTDGTTILSGGVPVTTNGTTRLINADGSAGLTALIATHVGVTGEAFYSHLDSKADIGSTTLKHTSYSFGLRFGLTVFID